MRRFVAALVTVFACAGLASLASAASPRDPVLHKRPADVALAKRLLLAKTDLPAGFRDAGPDRSGSNSNVDCKGVVQPDLHRLVMTADVSSHDFERTDPVDGFTQVRTEATLFMNAAEAEASIAWLVKLPKATLERCFATAVRAGLPKTAKTAGFHLTVVHRASGELHRDIWQLQMRFERSGVWFPVELVIGGYRRGRALEMLMVVNAAGELDPALMAELSDTVSARLTRATV
jgi:hypothetical protein